MYGAAKYNSLNVSIRMFVIQNSYADTKNLETVLSAIAVFNREGVISGVNNQFRDLTGISEDEIESGAANIFDYLRKENTRFTEFISDAFSGKYTVCDKMGNLITVKEEKREKFEPTQYTYAIFYPMSKSDDIKLAGIMIDKNEPDDTEGGT